MTRSLVINTASHAVPIRREFRMAELTDRFGTMVFSEEVMKDYLPKDIWKRLAATLEDGEPLDLDVANAVAHAMKVWAISKGATHYAHWFQPLSGITSELPRAQPRRHRHHQVYGQEPHPGRARCLQLPQRRPACHLRGPWLHRLGSHQPRLYQGRCPVHPHGFLLLHGRGPGQEDPAAAFHDRALA